MSPDNAFDADLKLALAVAQGDRAGLEDILEGRCGCGYAAEQRAVAAWALGDAPRALALYAEAPPDPARELFDLVTDDWVWRMAHVVNHAHLRLQTGDAGAREALRGLLGSLAALRAEGIVNPLVHYWAASAHAVLGERAAARAELRSADVLGGGYAWWQAVDPNLARLEGDDDAG